MQITAEPRDDYTILRLRGEFDALASPKFVEEVDAVKQRGIRRIVLDLQSVDFLNSTALGELIKVSAALAEVGGKLVICNPSSFCRHIFERIDFHRVVPLFETDEEAVANLGGERG